MYNFAGLNIRSTSQFENHKKEMKNVLILSFGFILHIPFASAGNYIINLSPMDKKEFSIDFQTVEIWPNRSCDLKVTHLEISSPVPEQDGGETVGKITMTTALDPCRPCRTGTGPNKGAMKLSVGWSLPELHYGKYAFVINDADEGTLTLTPGHTKFEK